MAKTNEEETKTSNNVKRTKQTQERFLNAMFSVFGNEKQKEKLLQSNQIHVVIIDATGMVFGIVLAFLFMVLYLERPSLFVWCATADQNSDR